MRGFEEKIDANVYSTDPDIKNKKLYQKFKTLAQWMMVDLPHLPDTHGETLKERGLFTVAEKIAEARMIGRVATQGQLCKEVAHG